MQSALVQDELFNYDRLITNFYFSNENTFKTPSFSLDLEDVLQEMRISIIDLVPKYDPTKGTTLSTFMYLSLTRKLIDLRAKALRRVKYCSSSVEDYAASSKNRIDEDGNTAESMMNYLHYKHHYGAKDHEEALCDYIDVKNILNEMKPRDRELYLDRHLKGYSYNELIVRHERSSENIRQRLRRIDKIFKTLRFQ